MPRTAHHLAALDQPVLSRGVRLGAAHDLAAADRGAFMRAAIEERIECVVDVVDADLAAAGTDDLAFARLALTRERNNVLRHQAKPYSASALSRMIIRFSASGTWVRKAKRGSS